MTIAISIENVSKQYRLGQVGTGTLAHDLNRWWAYLRGKEDPYARVGQTNDRTKKTSEDNSPDYVWALRDINLDVEEGQILGIIGRNGAGKSTLLKLLSRVTAPTTGRIRVRGRMASLLEVGTGFHPELTGRENIYLNGAILGMTRAEIRKRFDEIVDFSGCAKYIDTPVKRYSSGMYVRLAFAVAAHLEPEILIVDEVLAVGDADFQDQCIGKMEDVSRNSGRTILFVSHNMASIKRLCHKSILLSNGTVSEYGATDELVARYLATSTDGDRELRFPVDESPQKDGVTLHYIAVLDDSGLATKSLATEDRIRIRIAYSIETPIRNLRVCLNLYGADGTLILSTSDFDVQPANRTRQPGSYISEVEIPGYFLNTGRHVASIDLDIPLTASIISNKSVAFSIDELSANHLGLTQSPRPAGAVHPRLTWEIISPCVALT